MNNYTIYCTEEQTKKALELGAPIEAVLGKVLPTIANKCNLAVIEDLSYDIPTAEQMIGWLEEQGLYFSIVCIRDFVYEVWIKDINKFNVIIDSCINTRKKVTLIAIDTALDYLNDNSLIK